MEFKRVREREWKGERVQLCSAYSWNFCCLLVKGVVFSWIASDPPHFFWNIDHCWWFLAILVVSALWKTNSTRFKNYMSENFYCSVYSKSYFRIYVFFFFFVCCVSFGETYQSCVFQLSPWHTRACVVHPRHSACRAWSSRTPCSSGNKASAWPTPIGRNNSRTLELVSCERMGDVLHK